MSRMEWKCKRCGRITKIRNFHNVPDGSKVCEGAMPADFDEVKPP